MVFSCNAHLKVSSQIHHWAPSKIFILTPFRGWGFVFLRLAADQIVITIPRSGTLLCFTPRFVLVFGGWGWMGDTIGRIA